MKEIILTDGSVCKVDDDDFVFLSKWGWRPQRHCHCTYAVRTRWGGEGNPPEIVSMHRVVADAATGLDVDHINRNGLDNRRENLRLCTRGQNNANRGPWNKKKNSKYKGAHLHKMKNGGTFWAAAICKDYKQIHLGTFKTDRDAAIAYDKAAIELHGEFAYTNFPREDYF